MKTVFISGSSKIKRLNKEMTDCLDELMTQDVQVIVGDCYGVDFLAQKYLKAHNFDRVTVYTSTETPRRSVYPNFVSLWEQSQEKKAKNSIRSRIRPCARHVTVQSHSGTA